MRLLNDLFEKHKFVRRTCVLWAAWLITVVTLRVTEPEALPHINNATAVIVTAVIGLLTLVLKVYFDGRVKE
jgi:hypothetical protein